MNQQKGVVLVSKPESKCDIISMFKGSPFSFKDHTREKLGLNRGNLWKHSLHIVNMSPKTNARAQDYLISIF